MSRRRIFSLALDAPSATASIRRHAQNHVRRHCADTPESYAPGIRRSN